MESATIASGTLRGRVLDGCTAFLNIPYAAPPVGELRWRAPQPPQPWQGVRDATDFGTRCWQAAPMPPLSAPPDPAAVADRTEIDYRQEFHSNPAFPDRPESEDSLVVNVWTPAQTGTEKLPVAVWVHGGAFCNGSGQEIHFTGEAYAKRGVILVTLNYRLGLLGFFCHPDLLAEAGTCGNYGLLDQLAALRWVNENIAAFGGDPDNVTLFGQSAGAISTMLHCCSPLDTGLFRRVILQSGGGHASGFQEHTVGSTAADAALAGADWAKRQLGISTVAELRALPPETLRAAVLREQAEQRARQSKPGLGFLPYLAPVVDGNFVPDFPHHRIEAGQIQPVASMIGSNSEDLMAADMVEGSKNWAAKCTQLGLPCYAYYFSHQPQGDKTGAFHSCELWYTFGVLDRSWRPKTPEDYRLSDEMLDRWTAFMKHGDPNAAGLAAWPAYDPVHPVLYEFG